MKELRILHLFPRLLSLYGEYGNVAMLKATLEEKGCAVAEAAANGEITKSRYDSYKSLYEEAKQVKDWEVR